jgi:hypothetical protein
MRIVSMLLIVGSCLGLCACETTFTPTQTCGSVAVSSANTMDWWRQLLIWYLECLQRILEGDENGNMPGEPGYIEPAMNYLADFYELEGITGTTPASEARDTIYDTWYHLQDVNAEEVGEETLTRFKNMLLSMYVELGGDASDLQ